MTIRVCRLLVAALVAAGVAACGSTPASPTASTTGSDTWSTTVYPGSAVSRSFTASTAGTVTVTLVQSPSPVGFGIGVPATVGSGCLVSSGRVDGQGATLSAQVEQGDYCVSAYDGGTLAAPVGLLVRIDHP